MIVSIVVTLLVAQVAYGDHLFAKQDPKESPQQKPSEKLFFGDIALTPLQRYALNQTGVSYNAIIGDQLRWKDGIIPYTFDCSIDNNKAAVDAIHRAIHQWEQKTCMKFVKWTNEEFHLTFFRDTHCWGNVGQVSYSRISCGYQCEYEHVMAHEIGHVVGLYHEQNRKDRDDWVKVHWENIGQFRDAFEIVKNTDPLGIQYDYESIMHYPWTAFSSNGKITMEPIKPTNGKVPYIEISKDDIELVSRMYDCPAIEKKRKEHRLRKRLAESENIACVDTYPQCPMWKDWGHCFVDSVMLACPLSCNPECASSKPATSAPVQTAKPAVTTKPAVTSKPVVTSKPTTDVVDKTLPTTHLDEGWPNRNYLGTGQLCFNYHEKCEEWAGMGECKNNPGYMLRSCMWSCKKRGFNIDCDMEIPKPPGGCSNPLGLAYNGYTPKIPDSAFSAPNMLSPGGGWTAPPSMARLYNGDHYDTYKIGAWCAASHKPEYLQVDLGEKKTLTYIATQGRPKYFERIATFKIQYGDHPSAFTTYQEKGEDRIFNGNCDHSSPVLNQFNTPFTARYIRYVPWQWNYPCLRMELFGC